MIGITLSTLTSLFHITPSLSPPSLISLSLSLLLSLYSPPSLSHYLICSPHLCLLSLSPSVLLSLFLSLSFCPSFSLFLTLSSVLPLCLLSPSLSLFLSL